MLACGLHKDRPAIPERILWMHIATIVRNNIGKVNSA